jgi:hypothetical protein
MEFKLGPHDSLIQPSTDWEFDIDGDAEQLEKDMIEFMLAIAFYFEWLVFFWDRG